MDKRVAPPKRKDTDSQAALRRRLMPVLIAGCFGSALANPSGPQVVNGQASFITQGNTLTITNTPGAIINWQNFSIEQNELTRFLQQNPNSAVLNRIIGQDPSRILGALQSNGRVFLVNPNGILFGQGAQVDVNGLVASTLNIGNDDFIKGKWSFQAGARAGDLKNEGSITTPAGGQVYLIAPNVTNSGIITSPKGEVMLMAGRSVQLVDSANPDLHVVISAPEDRALNLGQVIAHSGKAGIYGALISQKGMVNANSAVVGENGKIVLKASGDTLLEAGSRTTATGEGKGGEVQVLGERVGLLGDAVIDASGKQGGGTVLVGGDYQGKNPLIQNASRAYVGSQAQIRADAIDKGNGGKIIVWSNDGTKAYGRISARGGKLGGDGGFAEVSGKDYLDFNADVNVGATKGKAGTLLLDPGDVTIQANSPTTVDITEAPANTFTSSGTTSILDNTLLSTRLDDGAGGGNNVVVQTTGGNITVAAPVTWSTDKSLTLNASGNISVGAALASTGSAGSVSLLAGNSISQSAPITAASLTANATSGSVALTNAGNMVGTLGGSAGTTFDFKNGNTDLTISGLSTSGSTTIESGAGITVSNWTGPWTGTRKLKAAGDIQINHSVIGGSGSDMLLESTGGSIAQSNGADIKVDSLSAIAQSSVTLNNSGNEIGTITGSAADGFTVASAKTMTVGASGIATTGSTGNIALTSSQQLAMASGSSITTAGGNVTMSGTGVATSESTKTGIWLNGASINAGAGSVSMTGSGDSQNGGTGVHLYQSSILANGGITINGTGYGSGGSRHGIKIEGKGSAGYSLKSSGEIELNGSTSATGSVNVGVLITDGAHIETTGDGYVMIDGTGGTGGDNNHGVMINGSATSKVLAENGEIIIQGTAGDTSTTSSGVGIGGTDSYIQTTGTGNISITAITPSGGQTGDFTLFSSSPNGIRTNGGNIQIKANNMKFISGVIDAGSGDVQLLPVSSNASIKLGAGATSASNQLGLTGTDLAVIKTSGKLTIGDIDSFTGTIDVVGALDVNTPGTVTGKLKLASGGSDVTVGAAVTAKSFEVKTTDGSIAVNAAVNATGTGVDSDNNYIHGIKLVADSGTISTAAAGTLTASGGEVSLQAGDTITLNGNINAKNIVLNSYQDLGINGAISASGTRTTTIDGVLHNLDGVSAAAGGSAVVDSAATIGAANGFVAIGAGVNVQNGGSVSAKEISLSADKMSLSTGTLTATDGKVTLASSSSVQLGVGIKDANSSTLELSSADLNSVHANTLNIVAGGDDFPNKSIIVVGNISPPVNTLALTSTGFISQMSGATVGVGDNSVTGEVSLVASSSGSYVSLPYSNPVGVIAGYAGSGNFVFRSANAIAIKTINGVAGITASANVKLKSDSGGISQSTGAGIAATGLVLEANGPANLGEESNSFTTLAANLNKTGPGAKGASTIYSANDLTIGSLTGVDGETGVSGVTTNNQKIEISTGQALHSLTVSQPIDAGTSYVELETDNLSLNNTVHGAGVLIHPHSAGLPITVGSATCYETNDGLCLRVNKLYNVVAQTVGIGSTENGNLPGNIYVAGITNTNTGAITDRNTQTTRIGLLSGGSITQSATTAIDVQDLGVRARTQSEAIGSVVLDNPSNSVSNIAGMTDGGDITFKNAGNVFITTLSNTDGVNSYTASGIDAGSGTVTLHAGSGSISGGTVKGNVLNATAGAGISLTTKVMSLVAKNTGTASDISITNNSSESKGNLTIGSVTQPSSSSPGNAGSSTGSVTIHNYGSTTVSGPVKTDQGGISITAHSPLSINGAIGTSSGAISLTASASSGGTDNLTINSGASVSSNSGAISLSAGNDISLNGTASVSTSSGAISVAAPGTVSGASNITTVSGTISLPSAAPTLSACISNPSLSGCSSVLPSLGTCVTTPGTAGCEVVLPSLSTCASSPSTAGCSAVLPSLSTCISNPSATGCSAVLPSLATCTSTPSTAGCTAVLPSLATCTANPTTAGCTAVLPTLTQCISTPSAAGCSAVLPSVATCVAAPSTTGCTVVLPTLAQCTANSALAGCSAVLPSLATCTATPSTAGCTAVLPTLENCTANPALAGCTAVLPTLPQCIATPTAAGCTAVLPSIGACTANPATPGCTVVLPTLSQCTSAPSTAGCSAVLPTLTQCTANPTQAGCTAVLPSIAQCTANPTAAGCTVVLPTLSACISAPATAGCTAVLPTISQCTANPSAAGCTVVLPTLAQCTATPSAAGCSAVLPSMATCTASPATAGCSAVLPSVAQCAANSTLPGCTVVLPSAASCLTNKNLPGCDAILGSNGNNGNGNSNGNGNGNSNATDTAGDAIKKTSDTVVSTTATTTETTLPASTPQGSSGGGTTKTAPVSETKSSGGKSDDSKSDKKDDAKKETSGPQDNGAKKDDTAKKMYCN